MDRGVEKATQYSVIKVQFFMPPSHLHTIHTRTHTKLPQSRYPPAHARVKLGVHQ